MRGDRASGAANDITLQVEYRPPGGGLCSASLRLTTIQATLAFRSAGELDDLNDLKGSILPDMGAPTLGPVSPGNPPGCKGFFKNMEIEATIEPNDPALPCRFNFRRTREGFAGLVTAEGGFLPYPPLNCPVGPCDDDPGDWDEDLTLSSGGTIYVIDSPGFWANPPFCGPGTDGQLNAMCLNFTESLEVDGQQCGPEVRWHAETQIKCQSGSWTEIAGSLGQGHIACVIASMTPSLPFGVPLIGRLLRSHSFEDRVKAHAVLVREYDSGQLSNSDQRELIRELTRIVDERRDQQGFGSALMLAIQLLGLLQAEEALPVFMERLLTEFEHPIASPDRTVAASALANLGNVSLPAIIERAGHASDREWLILGRVLRWVKDQAAVRRAVCAALDSGPGTLAEERLDHYLNERRRVTAIKRYALT